MKIALISHNDHTKLGGIETYNRNLINFLKIEHEVIEFPIDPSDIAPTTCKPIIKIDESLRMSKKGPYNISMLRKMKKLIKRDQFDIFILSARYYSKKILKSKKLIFVQHENEKTYTGLNMNTPEKIKRVLDCILGMGTLKNPFLIAKNKFMFHSSKFASIPPGIKTKFEYKKRQNNAFWAGRFVKTKGIEDLSKISKIIDNIEVYGFGELEEDVKKTDGKFMGSYSSDDKKKIFSKNKVFLLTSKNEGSETVVAEALSVGTPVVMFNDSTAANEFYNRCPGVFVTKKRDINEYSNLVESLLNMNEVDFKKLSRETYDWYIKNCSTDYFNKQWQKVIDYFKGKNQL